MSNLRIAIIGAGPAGLTLARLLQTNNIPCTIFELDANPNERNQGGTIDLHPQAGQLVLREAGLIDEFKRHSRPEGEAMKLVKSDGSVLIDENVTGSFRPAEYSDRPEIDRVKLRAMLLDSLQPGTVTWNKKLRSVEKSSTTTAKYDLHFVSGVEEGFDIVVGADGAWSKVRNFLTDTQPLYSGITAIELWALEVDERNPWLAEFVGKGSCFMFDEGRAIICQRSGNNSIRTYAAVRQPETWFKDCGIDWSNPDDARKELIERYFADCGEDLKRVISESNDQLIPRPMWMLPIGMKWEACLGVTVIGDGAHLMTPFAGVGVNLAMVDALKLARALIGCDDERGKLVAAIKEFEAEMFERGEQYAQKTWDNMESHFSATGGEARAQMLKGHGAQRQ
jgi:2-polyprenyl-6-methoxyphenol hydroxylase-like FAD-dependent oxidoreductase